MSKYFLQFMLSLKTRFNIFLRFARKKQNKPKTEQNKPNIKTNKQSETKT